jgi:hypothetical protein
MTLQVFICMLHTADNVPSKLDQAVWPQSFIQKSLASNIGGELADFITFLSPTSEISC